MKYEEELIWENYILLESFKDYKRKKVEEEEANSGAVDLYIERFKILKDANILNGSEKDISYWIKRPFSHFIQFVTEKESELKKRKLSKKQKKFNTNAIKNDPNVELIYNDDTWVAFGVKNFEGAAKWGSQTTDWCITKSDGHYDSYTEDSVFVFVFDLTKDPYNIHTKEGESDSKLAYRFDGDGDVTDIHNAADDEISNNQDLFETVYFDKIKKWAINNFDQISGVNFDKALDKADDLANTMNQQFKYGSISVDGQGKDCWCVGGSFSMDLSDIEFKEDAPIDNYNSETYKKIKEICERHTEHHEIELENDVLGVYINPEYRYGLSFEDGNNPIIDAVNEVESFILDLEDSYYINYYRIYNDLLEAELIENTDSINKLLNVYENISKNHIVVISGKSIHSYVDRIKSNIGDDLYVYTTNKYKEFGGDIDKDSIFASNDLLKVDTFEYGKYGIGIDIETVKKFQRATYLMSSRDEPKVQEEKNLKAIYKIIEDDDQLKVDMFKILNQYLHKESKTSFKKVYYS